MQKKGELSRLAVNLLIGSLIIILGIVIWIILRGGSGVEQQVFTDENIDLKISQVKKVNDNTLDLTLKRGEGEGNFVGLSFAVSDGSLTEVVRVNTSMPENQTANFSLNFISLNASRVKKISVTPIYLNEDGSEILGNVKDEYITPNTCSNYCPTGAQCGVNACGASCGNGCSSGYLCLNYKCIKQQTSSGGGGGSSGGSDDGDDADPTCTDTCSSLVKQCGIQTICGSNVNCGACSTGYVCSLGLCIANETCTDTCNSLNYNCGTHSICGSNVNCGTCSTGYTCQVNGTCIKDVVVSCNSVTCNSGEYCSNGVCLMNTSGKTYFVATNGNDAWSGNFTHPWKTWQKAFNTANSGDIVYFRGGTYYINSGISLSHSGNSLNWIYYFNYPGETPILDCSGMGSSWNIGITLTSIDYTHIKGLQIKNVKQRTGYTDLCAGIFVLESNHVKLENMVLSNIDGSGAYLSKNDYVEVINCDSYNNIDTYATDPGGWGMGFLVDGDPSFTSGYVSFKGCRAWNCSDQGYGAGNVYSPVVFDNCWSYNNGALHGEGMGFKFGMPSQPSDNQMDIYVKNSISTNNLGGGFDTNDGPYLLTNWLYNNFAYNNGAVGNDVTAYGFLGFSGTGSTTDRIFKNNIAYQNLLGAFRMYGGPYTEQYNSWNTPPGVTVNSNDFVSLNYSQLKQPRKADGSLPDITFGHLAQGSDLIDKGVVISGYHCVTSGSHPGEDCVEWYGSAPDLGPFESNYASSCNGVTCNSGEYCSNGVCLMNVTGKTYFVATNGSDSNPGTFSQPWYSWQKAFDTANAGDLVYFRGGVWYPTVYVTHDPSSGHGHNGTLTNPILFYNYPGEKPILDCINFTSTIDASGLDIREDTYIKFRGLTVMNVKEKAYDHWIAAIQTYNTGVIYLEMMSSHDNGGHGFTFNTYNTIYVTNCDSYNNADIRSSEPGNRADGFSGGSGGSDTDLYKAAYYTGCRAWNNSDDGFDIGSSKQVRISNSWSFNNGYLPYGGGVGFKFGPSNIQDPIKRLTYNTLAVNNNYDGYAYQNLNDALVGPVGAFYNNFAYKCNMGFTSDQGGFDCTNGYTQSIYRNNLVYQSTYGSTYDQTYLSLCAYTGPYNASRFIQENNSWIHQTDWPFWEYNPAVTVTEADFVSLDVNQLLSPRNFDGSLPSNITFAHLTTGSDLIDAGTIIQGYHCSTSGSHPGENCREWYGTAPDLGAFESNY